MPAESHAPHCTLAAMTPFDLMTYAIWSKELFAPEYVDCPADPSIAATEENMITVSTADPKIIFVRLHALDIFAAFTWRIPSTCCDTIIASRRIPLACNTVPTPSSFISYVSMDVLMELLSRLPRTKSLVPWQSSDEDVSARCAVMQLLLVMTFPLSDNFERPDLPSKRI